VARSIKATDVLNFYGCKLQWQFIATRLNNKTKYYNPDYAYSTKWLADVK